MSRPGSTLPQGKTRYPLYRRLGGPQGRSGLVRKISPHRNSITISGVYYIYLRHQSYPVSKLLKGNYNYHIFLGFCKAYIGSCLQVFRYSLSVPSSRIRQSILRNIQEERSPQVPGYLRYKDSYLRLFYAKVPEVSFSADIS